MSKFKRVLILSSLLLNATSYGAATEDAKYASYKAKVVSGEVRLSGQTLDTVDVAALTAACSEVLHVGPTHPTLTGIYLDNTGIDNSAFSSLLFLWSINAFPIIDLSGNKLDDHVLSSITSMLRSPALNKLVLTGNYFSDRAKALLEAVNADKSTPVELIF